MRRCSDPSHELEIDELGAAGPWCPICGVPGVIRMMEGDINVVRDTGKSRQRTVRDRSDGDPAPRQSGAALRALLATLALIALGLAAATAVAVAFLT